MKVISGYQNTKTNKEDFAITPYIFLVKMWGVFIKVIGIGLCWGHHSVYIGLGFNLPKDYKLFRVLK